MYYGPSQNRGRTYRQIYNKLFTKILQVYCGPPQSAGKAYQPTNKIIFGQSGELAVWSKFSEKFSPIENFANKEYCQLGICAKVQNHIGNGVRPVQKTSIFTEISITDGILQEVTYLVKQLLHNSGESYFRIWTTHSISGSWFHVMTLILGTFLLVKTRV